MNKVVLILVDGMRPDAVKAAGHPFAEEMLAHGTHFLAARTVMPSNTLPCHMSLFHSVEPSRHGILTNTYVPQARPIKGLCEVLRAAEKKCAFFYNWEELRDLTRPDSLAFSAFVSGHIYGDEAAAFRTAAFAKQYIASDTPDFAFVYLGWTDLAGHLEGWMGEEYLRAVKCSWGMIEDLCRSLPDEYLVIVMADHGGHLYNHGTEEPEDMTIPIFCYNRNLPSALKEGGRIIDVAPTVCKIVGVKPDPDWRGAPLPL